MNDLVKEQIYSLKQNTVNFIDSIQRFHIPSLLNFINLTQVRTYTFEGSYHGIYNDHTRFYIINNLLLGRSTGKESCYIDSFTNLIRDGIVMPFLLFIDGKLVKWSDMTIVKDYNYTFLIIDGKFNDPDSYNTILLPCNIRYGEDSLIDQNAKVGLYFDEDGKLTYDFPIHTRVELLDDSILVSKTVIVKDDREEFIIENLDNKSVLTSNNFIVFKNGLLYTDGFDYIEHLGANVFKYTDIEYLTEDDEVVIFCFYNLELKGKNLISNSNISSEKLVDHIIENNERTTLHPYLNSITKTFSFDFTNSNQDENLSSALDYISRYDRRMLTDVYKNTSKTKSLYYSGKYLKEIAVRNKITMPRRNPDNMNISGIMIFNNESLYEFHDTIEFSLNSFSFYVDDTINDDDKIEILYFFNIENPSIDIIVSKDVPIHLDYDIRDVEFYYSEDRRDKISYKIEYSYQKINDGYLITFDDKYYDIIITMVSKNQYHHISEIAEYNKVYVELNSDFKFCTNPNNYMLFINGQKIPTSMTHIVTPSKEDCRDVLSIFTNIPIMKNDKVNVFYLPNYNHKLEVAVLTDGIVDVSGALGFDLDANLYTFYINGRKLHPDYFSVINRNKIRVSKNIGSIRNIEIYQYFSTIQDIDNIRSNRDLFDISSDLFTDSELDDLYGIKETLEDNEDITTQGTTNKALNYELINSFNRRPDLEQINPNSGEFLYNVTDIISDDLDDSVISRNKVDDEGNYIIDLGFAILEDKAPIYETNDGIPNYNYKQEDE